MADFDVSGVETGRNPARKPDFLPGSTIARHRVPGVTKARVYPGPGCAGSWAPCVPKIRARVYPFLFILCLLCFVFCFCLLLFLFLFLFYGAAIPRPGTQVYKRKAEDLRVPPTGRQHDVLDARLLFSRRASHGTRHRTQDLGRMTYNGGPRTRTVDSDETDCCSDRPRT